MSVWVVTSSDMGIRVPGPPGGGRACRERPAGREGVELPGPEKS